MGETMGEGGAGGTGGEVSLAEEGVSWLASSEWFSSPFSLWNMTGSSTFTRQTTHPLLGEFCDRSCCKAMTACCSSATLSSKSSNRSSMAVNTSAPCSPRPVRPGAEKKGQTGP